MLPKQLSSAQKRNKRKRRLFLKIFKLKLKGLSFPDSAQALKSLGPALTLTTKASATAANDITALEKGTLYDVLGISENGTPSEIKHAYKKMALKYHPDVSPPDRVEEYTVRFIKLQEAYETLSDPEARSAYDRCMARGLHYGFSGKREARFDASSDDKKVWREMWKGQISELMRRRANPSQTGGMTWAARIRKQRSGSCVSGSDPDQ